MKALVLNLPHSSRIYRCYRCSINSPAFCLPPLELLYLASLLREAGVRTDFLDATAERINLEDTIQRVRQLRPDLIVSIMGYEHFTDDVHAVNLIREHVEVPHYAVMGYLPSHFPEETLSSLRADMILQGEPEHTLREAVAKLRQGGTFEGVAGLAWRDGQSVQVGPLRPRMTPAELEALPLPARDLLNIRLYREPFLSTPFTTYQAGRGCPYRCIYCARTYGNKYAVRSPAHVVAEIEETRHCFGIRHFRFVDDTFGVDMDWTREFTERMEATGGRYEWVGLTRVDLMDPERMRLMRRAGCRRLYVGIESGSQKVLDYYQKRYDVGQVPRLITNARRAGIEVVGYFVVGSPVETEADYQQTVDLAGRLRLDMISVYPMMPYPGTTSYADGGPPVDFTLFPFQIRYRDPRIMEVAKRRARSMMRESYLSTRFVAGRAKWFLRYPRFTFQAGWELGNWLLKPSKQKRQSFI